MKIFDYIFVVLTIVWYLLYALTFSNLSQINQYFDMFVFYYKVYVCLLLIFYFNPYINVKLTKVKKQMIFTSSLMLLFSIGFKNIFINVSSHFNFIKNKIQ